MLPNAFRISSCQKLLIGHFQCASSGRAEVNTASTRLSSPSTVSLADLDSAFVDLRVSCMDASVMEVLEGKNADDADFCGAVQGVVTELAKKVNANWTTFTDLIASLSSLIELVAPVATRVLECIVAPQKRLNKNVYEVFEQDVLKPHADYQGHAAKLQRMVRASVQDRTRGCAIDRNNGDILSRY